MHRLVFAALKKEVNLRHGQRFGLCLLLTAIILGIASLGQATAQAEQADPGAVVASVTVQAIDLPRFLVTDPAISGPIVQEAVAGWKQEQGVTIDPRNVIVYDFRSLDPLNRKATYAVTRGASIQSVTISNAANGLSTMRVALNVTATRQRTAEASVGLVSIFLPLVQRATGGTAPTEQWLLRNTDCSTTNRGYGTFLTCWKSHSMLNEAVPNKDFWSLTQTGTATATRDNVVSSAGVESFEPKRRDGTNGNFSWFSWSPGADVDTQESCVRFNLVAELSGIVVSGGLEIPVQLFCELIDIDLRDPPASFKAAWRKPGPEMWGPYSRQVGSIVQVGTTGDENFDWQLQIEFTGRKRL